jgi:hypothetical protein
MHKWSLPKWKPFICAVSEWQDVLRCNISCVEKILILIKFILINFGNGFVDQNSHVFSFTGVLQEAMHAARFADD